MRAETSQQRCDVAYEVILSRKNDKYVSRVKEWLEVTAEEMSRE
jgi:hypothetical protein